MGSRAWRRPGRLALGAAPPWWRRSPSRVGRWVLAVGLALVTSALVAGAVGHADDTVAGWGATRSVIVAQRDLEPGQVVAADDVTRRTLPEVAIPGGALTDEPVGRVVTSPILAGEVVSRLRLAPDGAHGVAALVPDGRRAVAVPTDRTGLHLRIGDRVDVFAPSPPDAGLTRSERTAPVATDAVVVDVDEAAVTVAVDRDQVAAVARALGQGTPILALVGTG